jgi:hypothetical protein
MSDHEFSATSTHGEVFEASDPSCLSGRAGFAAAVEAGLADRQQTHNWLAALRMAAGITQEDAAEA